MSMSLKKDKIFYWANSELKNDGEGILANNFLFLLKNNFKNSSLISINKIKLKNKQSIFAKYILPFYGVILLWGHYLKNEKISYINYLPAWNFLLILLLPPRTIIGPVTGSINRKNWKFFLAVSSYIGIKLLLIKYKKIIFSHDFFKSFISKKNIKNCFFNFLLFNFKKKINNKKKQYDFIFYLRKHNNKGNQFFINLIKILSEKNYKICVIGQKLNVKKNVSYKGIVTRKKSLQLISVSKYSLGSSENLFSFFVLDCLSNNLKIFFNKNFKIDKKLIKTNLLIPIDFYNLKKSLKSIDNSTKNKNLNILKFKKLNFWSFFS
jgi:hypothetical protein